MSHTPPPDMDPRLIPGMPPPEGVESNFDNPSNGNDTAYACLIICVFLTSISALTRICFLIMTRTIPRLEDYLAGAALALYMAYVYCAFWFMDICGYYVRQWDVRAVEMADIFYIVHVCTFLFEAGMMAIKVAILLEWARIFAPKGSTARAGRSNKFALVCYALIALNVSYYTAVIIAGNLACTPYELIWDHTVEGTCSFDPLIILAITGGINLLSDLCILIMPQGKIWHLNMSLKKKISVSIVFSLGLIGIIAAAIRVWAGVNAYESDDKVYTIADVALWCLVEITTGFVVFCLPMAPKVFGTRGLLFGKLRGSRSSDAWQSGSNKYATGGGGDRYIRVEGPGSNATLPLRSLARAKQASQTADEALDLEEQGILRTTRIEIQSDFAKNGKR